MIGIADDLFKRELSAPTRQKGNDMDDKSAEGVVLLQLAKSHWQDGQTDQALNSAQNALAAFKEAGDTRNMAACLADIGMIMISSGDTQSAVKAFQVALTIAQKHRYDDIAQTLNQNLDTILQSLGVDYQPPKKTIFQKLFKKDQ